MRVRRHLCPLLHIINRIVSCGTFPLKTTGDLEVPQRPELHLLGLLWCCTEDLRQPAEYWCSWVPKAWVRDRGKQKVVFLFANGSHLLRSHCITWWHPMTPICALYIILFFYLLDTTVSSFLKIRISQWLVPLRSLYHVVNLSFESLHHN